MTFISVISGFRAPSHFISGPKLGKDAVLTTAAPAKPLHLASIGSFLLLIPSSFVKVTVSMLE